MCWKRDKGRPHKTEGGQARVWSITQRFVFLYTASTAVLLLVGVGFLHWVLQRSLDARDHALLVSKAKVLSLLLQEAHGNAEVIASEVEHEATEGPLRYYLRILHPDGQILIETPGMSEILPRVWFPVEPGDIPDPPEKEAPNVRHYENFILLSVVTAAGPSGDERRILQLALDVSLDLKLLALHRRRLIAVLSLGVLFAAAVGGWLARKGTLPLLEMTKRAQQISASHLNERIVPSQWPVELQDLAVAFNAMLDRLEDSFARMSRCTADLAHELRTPINNLRGEAEVTLRRARSFGEYQEVLESSLEELERLSRLIDDMLFLARADNPTAAVRRVRFNARQDLEALAEFHEASAAEKGVRLVCQGDVMVWADPTLFRRAVSNLISNAVRHTPAGGEVTVCAEAAADGSAHVSVSDTGEGIPTAEQARVFERFYRGSHSRRDRNDGTGLGLAIVDSILRAHGGSTDVESEPSKGARFTLRFPPAPQTHTGRR